VRNKIAPKKKKQNKKTKKKPQKPKTKKPKTKNQKPKTKNQTNNEQTNKQTNRQVILSNQAFHSDEVLGLRIFQCIVNNLALCVEHNGAILSDEARKVRTQSPTEDLLNLLHASTSRRIGLQSMRG
jgi:outer membrane biosynthesis protein TonB